MPLVTRMTKEVLISDKNLDLWLQWEGGVWFLHLTLHNTSKGLLQICKDHLGDFLIGSCRSLGIDPVFATAGSETTLKFYNMVRPYDYYEEINSPGSERTYLVGWDTDGN